MNILRNATLVVASLAVVALTSCKKDDVATPDSLTGTEWTTDIPFMQSGVSIIFTETGFSVEVTTPQGTITPAAGNYTYEKPNVTFTLQGGIDFGTGVVNGKKLTVTADILQEMIQSPTLILTKK